MGEEEGIRQCRNQVLIWLLIRHCATLRLILLVDHADVDDVQDQENIHKDHLQGDKQWNYFTGALSEDEYCCRPDNNSLNRY